MCIRDRSTGRRFTTITETVNGLFRTGSAVSYPDSWWWHQRKTSAGALFLRSDGVLSDMRNLFWQQRTEQYPGCFWRKRTLQFSALLSHRGQSCTYHWRMADQRRSKPENLLEFHSGQGLPELKLDRSASPDRASPCDLPCSRPWTPASWTGRTSDGWGDKLCPETQDADFSGNP